MRIWRLITGHADANEAIERIVDTGRVAVGWGLIGDVRHADLRSAKDVTTRITRIYPDVKNAHLGGPSLWNFVRRMEIGDLLILSKGGVRYGVAEVTGPYFWTSEHDAWSDYQHQRAIVLRDENPDALWGLMGGAVASGEGPQWTVALCGSPAEAGVPDVARYSEGSRYDILATGVERSAAAREACIRHHGAACAACGMDFGKRYGDLGDGFIHVHHVQQLADTNGEHEVDPVTDLIPLCPNCHAMVHRVRPALSVSELKQRIR